MAASGAVALYHIEGITPEAKAHTVLADDAVPVIVEDLDEGYEALDGTAQKIDLVWIGCPHASLRELTQVAALLGGRPTRAKLWITTARAVLSEAKIRGLVETIERSGGQVVADACLIGAPVQEMGLSTVATNSAKAAFYLHGHHHLEVRFGPLHRCVEAAVKGRWPG
jgi:predicted aconitase